VSFSNVKQQNYELSVMGINIAFLSNINGASGFRVGQIGAFSDSR
jgi:hypothetical protein